MKSLYSGVFSISVLRTRFAHGPLRSRSGVGAAILSPFCPPDYCPLLHCMFLNTRCIGVFFLSFLLPKASQTLEGLYVGFAKTGDIRAANLIMIVEGVGLCPEGK